MPATVQSIIAAANAEWNKWGKSTWNTITGHRNIGHTDDENPFAQIVLNDYCALVGDSPTLDEISNDDYAWSAVGMSYFMKTAGFTKNEFPFSDNHSFFIRKFIAARQNGGNLAYWGYQLTEPQAVLAVGDMIGYGRGKGMTYAKAQALFNRKSAYPSHTDVVVAVREGEVDVIGANVMDSVTKKTLKISANGHLTDKSHNWFVVLKRQP